MPVLPGLLELQLRLRQVLASSGRELHEVRILTTNEGIEAHVYFWETRGPPGPSRVRVERIPVGIGSYVAEGLAVAIRDAIVRELMARLGMSSVERL